MLARLFVRNTCCVALAIAVLAAGNALAGHGGRGGGGGGGGDRGGGHSWSGGGGGGGGGGRSWSGGGGGGSLKGWSGGSGKSSWSGGSKSWSGGSKNWSGGSSSSPSMRSFRSQSGGWNKSASPGKSTWSGNVGSIGNHQNSTKQFRDFSKGNFSGKDFSGNSQSGNNRWGNNIASGQTGDAKSQFRGYRGLSNGDTTSGFPNAKSRQRGGNDQLQQMFKKYHEQQASATGDIKTFDRSRGKNNGSNNWSNQFGKGDNGKSFANSDGGNRNWRSNNGNNEGKTWLGNLDGKQFSGDQFARRPGGQFGQGGDFKGGKGGGQFGKWSKNDNGNSNPQTARWFGKSGFGDHRGDGHGDWGQGDFARGGNWDGGKWNRGDWNGKGGKWEGGKNWGGDKWGDHVRNEWNKNWWNKHGHHDSDWYRGRGWRDVPFAYGWWGGRRNFGSCYYWNGWWNNPWYWWAPCSAPLLTTWINFGWNYPCYWDYGPGQYVTYYNQAVYVDGQRYATELDYYAQTRNLARSVPTLTQDQLAAIEWLPLGVFGVTRAGQPQANELVQLAVSKDGLLSGTWFDQQTGQTRPLQGRVDQATQKAAWCFADSPTDTLVVETSLYNLTEPQCSALAHLDAVSTEVWQLVRLQQPAGAQPPPAAAPAGQANAPAAQPVLPPQGEVK